VRFADTIGCGRFRFRPQAVVVNNPSITRKNF
jgi:hypothetical protein